MDKLFTKTGLFIGIVAAFCLLLCSLIWSRVTRQIARDREETIIAAAQRNANLAVSLEQYTIRTLRNADAVLQLVQMEYEQEGSAIDFHVLLNKGPIDAKYFDGVGIADELGNVLVTDLSIPASGLPNVSDREHFRFHQYHKDRLFVGTPVMSRTIDKAVIILSRRINKPDGSFGGTISIQVKPETFTHFYSNASLLDNEIISLVSPEGITYARRTGNRESHGENIIRSPLFKHVDQNPVGCFTAPDAIRNIPSLFCYRKLEEYPIIATVGSSEEAILASHYERARRDYVFSGLMTILLFLFSTVVCVLFVSRKKHIRKLGASEARHRSIFENSQDSIIVLCSDGSIEAMNAAARKMFEVDNKGIPAKNFFNLFTGTQPLLSMQNAFAITNFHNEVEFQLAGGNSFVGEMAHSTYLDAYENTRIIVLIRNISHRKEMEKRLLKEQKRYQRKLTKQIIHAQERERERIGHELHDNVNQILTTVKLYMEMAMKQPELRDELLPKSIHYVMDCINEIRNLSHELSAPTLGTQSLVDAMKALSDTVALAAKIKIVFNADAYHTPISKDQKLALYRILQEQFNNVVKHSKASAVSVMLSQDQQNTRLCISDNGKGFDTNNKMKGIGLNNVLSRTKIFGGQMRLTSLTNEGCTLEIVMPTIAEKPAGPMLIGQADQLN